MVLLTLNPFITITDHCCQSYHNRGNLVVNLMDWMLSELDVKVDCKQVLLGVITEYCWLSISLEQMKNFGHRYIRNTGIR